jgi:hypothetical protein
MTGQWMTGQWMTGQWMTGQWMTGQWMTGQWMTGQWMTGQWMTGQWMTGPVDDQRLKVLSGGIFPRLILLISGHEKTGPKAGLFGLDLGGFVYQPYN